MEVKVYDQYVYKQLGFSRFMLYFIYKIIGILQVTLHAGYKYSFVFCQA